MAVRRATAHRWNRRAGLARPLNAGRASVGKEGKTKTAPVGDTRVEAREMTVATTNFRMSHLALRVASNVRAWRVRTSMTPHASKGDMDSQPGGGAKTKGGAMRSTGTRFAIALLSAALLAGCGVMAHGPVTAPITLDQRGPVTMGSGAGRAKVGRAEAYGILIYSTGDASISAAMRAGGITRVHHVDHETMNIMGVYAKYTTIVYGE